jgi:3-methyladenine DNA glycosylase AlkD
MGGMAKASDIIKKLKAAASTQRAKDLLWFFKTGPGEYGEGDIFLGVTVPQIRAIVKESLGLGLREVEIMLASKFHEVRMAGALCLVEMARKADIKTRKKLFDLYLKNRTRINNWDLVDLSAPAVVGEYLLLAPQAKTILKKLSQEKSMWSRRIAILATFAFIRVGRFNEPLTLAKKYLSDQEDLMHKATGWMLREVGKRDKKTLVEFLNKHTATMPRTMLRYAIEKFSHAEREYYMKIPSLRARAKQSRRSIG